MQKVIASIESSVFDDMFRDMCELESKLIEIFTSEDKAENLHNALSILRKIQAKHMSSRVYKVVEEVSDQ